MCIRDSNNAIYYYDDKTVRDNFELKEIPESMKAEAELTQITGQKACLLYTSELAFTLHVTGDGLTRRLYLTTCDPCGFKCFDCERTGCKLVSSLSNTCLLYTSIRPRL